MQGPRTRRRGKIFAHYLSLLVVEHGKATRHDEDPGGRINGRSARSANLETFFSKQVAYATVGGIMQSSRGQGCLSAALHF